MEDEKKEEGRSGRQLKASSQVCDRDIHQNLLEKRYSYNEQVLRFLSLLCLTLMFGLILIQLDILWRSRESLIMDMLLHETHAFYFRYPDFYDVAHNEETWCWDPVTLLLKVNTSLFVH